jgi:rhodanese-related sulfurtransferase
MDTVDSHQLPSVSSSQLASRIGRADCPLILDVRKAEAFDASSRLLPAALRVEPDRVNAIATMLPHKDSCIVYCVHGHEVSQGAVKSLRAAGLQAAYLEQGIAGWIDAGLPTMAKVPDLALPAAPGRPTLWVTRERPKIDRIACPWLIRRFIDPTARFLYVPAGDVISAAKREGAVPYDVPDVRISHRGPEGELCSFDALVADCGLDDPALHDLARIVRGADTGRPELTPESPGLLAISLGLSASFPDDLQMLDAGMVVYDALYAWIRSARAEVHNAVMFRKA